MRIMHVITRLILGGAQENTLLSVLGQMEAGHEVRLVCGPTTGPEGSLVQEALAAGVDYLELPELVRPLRPLDDLFALRALCWAVREFAPTVVHTHSSKAGVLGRAAAWRERVPCVVHTIHGLPFHPYQAWSRNRLYIAAERYAARRCHRLVSVAAAMTAQAAAAGVAPPEKFVTVYSGMRVERFLRAPAPRAALRREFGVPADALVVGKVARLFELKGHDFLFDACSRLVTDFPRLHLLLVGDGTWRERLQARVRALGLRERVTFAGLVGHDRVPRAIHAMDLVAHCSLREGLARVLPQALLAGRPVVSFDVDGAREVVLPGRTGWLVPPGDTAALERAMREALAAPEQAAELAAAGRELCRERFAWRRMVTRLLEIYSDHLTGADGRIGCAC